MANLIRLDLSKNEISALPASIEKLSKLEYADFSFNRLISLPNSICNLKKLKTLLLIDNSLERLPPLIGSMESLVEINLYKNNLDDLPPTMHKLGKVEIVDLDYNPLGKIPALIRDEGWDSICRYLASSALERRKIRLKDHTQVVGEGCLGRNVPAFIATKVALEEKKRLQDKLEKGTKFDFQQFEVDKAKRILAHQARKPSVNNSVWLLFAGDK